MNTTIILNNLIQFFQITLPPLFIGFLIANTLKSSSYLRHAGIPMNPVIRISYLPQICASVLTLFFLSSWSGMSMLSHYYHERILEERSIIATVLIAQFPKAMHSVIFFQAPIALSVLGVVLGGIIIASELILTFVIAAGGVVYARKHHPAHDYRSEQIIQDPKISPNPELPWKEFISVSLKNTCLEFFKVARILIPTGAVLIIVLDLGISSLVSSYLDPLMQIVHLPSFSIIVIASAFVSQVAVLTAAGTLVDLKEVTVLQCLFVLFIARAIHLGIGYLKTSLPTNISLFDKDLGVRVTTVESLTMEGGLLVLVIITGIFLWMS